MLSELKFHHIGVLTGSMNETLAHYTGAGFSTSEIVYDAIQDVNICFLSKAYHPDIELIEPASNESKVIDTLRKNGPGPYHFCYETDDINAAILKLKEKRFMQLSRPVKAVAIENKLICFLFNKEIGLIELVQSK